MISNSQTARDESLQILRFIAAALVLVTHITFYIHERIDSGVDIWHGGEAGVPIFFVISGVVMYLSGTKLSRNSEGAKYFLCRRLARVIPLYWLITTLKVAIALIVPTVVLHNHPDLLRTLGSYLLFPMLNGEGEVRPIHGVAWTLLHEMFFYYAFSISLLLRQSPFICSSLIIVALWVIGLFVSAESALARVYFSEINLLFVAGMILALLHKRGFRLPQGIALTLFFSGVAMLVSPELRALRGAFLGGFDIGAVFIVAASISIQATALPKIRMILVRLGDSSYSLYMLHPILAPAACIALFKLFGQSIFLIIPMAFLICVVASHIAYRLVENPLNTKARKFLERLFIPSVPSQVVIQE